jgi:nitrogen fixation NifU-like protein
MSEEGKASTELDDLVESIMSVLDAEDSKIYSQAVISEFKNPANVGTVENADGIGISDGLCNDTMEITLKLDGDRIAECMFFTDGCGATIACGSRLTKMAIGQTVVEALDIQPEELAAVLGGLPEEHKHCAALAVIALRNAIRNGEKHHVSKAGGEKE